jgi:hypothetical protein
VKLHTFSSPTHAMSVSFSTIIQSRPQPFFTKPMLG